MPVVNGISFPEPALWIPNTDVLNDVGESLLAVAAGALEVYGFGAEYDRQVVGHGAEVPLEPSKAGQLTVVCNKVFLGRAGEEQFQFAKGEPGKLGFQTGQFFLVVARPYPKRQGTQAIASTDISALRAPLWRDGVIVWAAMVSLALGGVTPPPGGVLSQDGIAVGPMAPRGPLGGVAAWQIEVQVQL